MRQEKTTWPELIKIITKSFGGQSHISSSLTKEESMTRARHLKRLAFVLFS